MVELFGIGGVGALTQNAWATIIAATAILLSLWIGATATAPIRQRNEARQELAKFFSGDDKDDTAPDLSIRVNQRNVGKWPDGRVAVTLIMSVYNGGAPSIAENYALSATIEDGTRLAGAQWAFEGTLTCKDVDGNEQYTFDAKNMLSNKTYEKVLAQGSRSQGWLLFLFPQEMENALHADNTVWEISVADFRENRTNYVIPSLGPGQVQYFPGLR